MSKLQHTIFTDLRLAGEFEERGYVVIDLLDADQLEALRKIYLEAGLEYGQHFYSSSFIENPEIKKEISRKIEAVVDVAAAKHFTNFRKLGATFLVKPPGPGGTMPIHQDWTVVDESKFSSITAWIPLQDTDTHNGTVKVLPGSHMLSNALRSPTLPDPISGVREAVESFMQTLPLKAGQAFVFSHALYHSSGPNNSGSARIAIAYGMLPQSATFLFYYKAADSDRVEVIKVEDDFFLNYPKPGERPKGQLLSTMHYVPVEVAKDALLKKYSRHGDIHRRGPLDSIKQKLRAIFGQ